MSLTNIDEFWLAYLATLPPGQPPPARCPAWYFGDSPALADELGDLVLAGRKSATCTLLAEFEHEHEPLPEPGERAVITRFDGEPLCIIVTTGVEVLPFDSVNADFAYAEGEGDRSLASWRRKHRRYFTRRCAQLGLKFSPDMLVVCERFRRVYPP